jgi:hypothetical protein
MGAPSPERITAADAIMIRLGGINQIIRTVVWWVADNPQHSRAKELGGELGAGAKAVVLYYAEQAGQAPQPPRG